MVVADDPSDTEVTPMVIALYARFALVIPADPERLLFVIPLNV